MKIGILGAGQLGRMLALAGYPLDFDFVFLDPATEACAAPLGEHIHADYQDERSLAEFCVAVDIATYEFENVPAKTAEFVSGRIPLLPAPVALAVGQDRLSEKQLFDKLKVPVPRYMPVATREALELAVKNIGLPAVLKTRRLGYDGKGQAVLRKPEDLDPAFARLGGQPLILEAFVPFQRELSCLAVRGKTGELRYYPVVANVHRDGILRTAIPQADDPLQKEAEDYARRVVEHLGYVGVLAFEFFVSDGRLLANEIAPRVHNSGHWSIEGAVCSQFENHLRAIAGLPLGDTSMRGPSAMVNFIGDAPANQALAAIPGVHIHHYGKTPKPQRKVGHATITAGSEAELSQRLELVSKLADAVGD
ncbi:5-(carboxyamino)imidazole ribonucleotide synthase [Solimonas sp. K1W22B-7]|uniref:5-(carboxyamino)imidazole ribonucleotide synthase n=1 Tax=Solimonas sp. K1W22B-7 TaxID=2303331 RepID=UPI000E3314CD|nr:5-(carboxyamino)imidazole ribonucleotide synthase [Solimonas sp. K1W22B-7]AXQ27282.1 5-(carboxyamino)imidazole ribonucleotide synthase [Solimonas sp. K1W22B-7]